MPGAGAKARAMTTCVLTVPGLWSSGPDHWQTLWEAAEPTWRRIQQSDWNTPSRADWVATIDAAVVAAPGPVVLAAHSLGCVAVAYWGRLGRGIQGAFLVAPADVEAASLPEGPRGFSPMPLERLPFRSIVVASTNDPYISIERARFAADAWGSAFVNVGAVGHINASSGLGSWPDGRALLGRLLEGSERRVGVPPAGPHGRAAGSGRE